MPTERVPPSIPRSAPRRGATINDIEIHNVAPLPTPRERTLTRQRSRFCERCIEARRFSNILRRASENPRVIMTLGTLAMIVIGVASVQSLFLTSTIGRLERTFGPGECIIEVIESKQLQLRADAPLECADLLYKGGRVDLNMTSLCTTLCEAVNCDEDGKMIIPERGGRIEDEISDSGSGFNDYDNMNDQEIYNTWWNQNKPTTISTPVPSVTFMKNQQMTVTIMKKEGIVQGNTRVCTCTIVNDEEDDCVCNQLNCDVQNAVLKVYIYMSPFTMYRTNHVNTVLNQDQH